MSTKKAAYENPLMPNARLRQIYRAILRAHLLGQSLRPAQRALTAGREAALVSTSVDLTARDLVLDAFGSPVLDFLRGATLPHALDPSRKSPSRILADCGAASRLPIPATSLTRIQFAMGAAAAQKAAAAEATQSPDSSSNGSAVVTIYATSGDLSAAEWKSALDFATQHDLPLLFILLPRPAGSKQKPVDLHPIAHRIGVPAIPVDAADPVALYRVAQESIGHARIGGGPAVIDCVALPVVSAPRKLAALAHLEDYILSRGVATRTWMDREALSFSEQIRKLKSASK